MIEKLLRRKAGTDRPLARRQLGLVQDYTLCDEARLQNLARLAAGVSARGVAGAVVECGVYNGGAAAATALGFGQDQRDFWLYDSFEGLPETSEADGPDAARFVGDCVGDPERVREVFRRLGHPESRLRLHKGWFQDTLPAAKPDGIALLHIDADWFDSVLLCLRELYPRVPTGGAVVLDDFGHWEGCREAFYAYCQETGERPLLERCGYTQAWWIKGRTHNRGSSAP